jgi:uncharacterized protein YggE
MKSFWQIVILILLVAAIGVGVAVWQPWKSTNRTIQTSGEGKIKASPDVAQITGGVQIKKSTADEAQTTASQTINTIVAAVKAAGIADKDIQTQSITTNPNYNYNNGNNTIDGYMAQSTITITVRDLSHGQDIADLVTKNGGTNVYGPSLTFSNEKMAQLKNQARAQAMIDAKNKADQLAQLSNAKLGKVVNVSESNFNGGIVQPYPLMATDSAKSVSGGAIMPGENEVTLDINVTFSLK